MRGIERHWTVLLALIASLLPGCVVSSHASLVPGVVASAAAEQRINSLIHEWFAGLEGGILESRTLDRLMAEPSFELSLIGADVQNPAELEAWRANLHATHLDLVYQIGSVEVEPVGEDLHRARFEFERRAVDHGGIPHIARREHVWLVRIVSGESAVILRIDERLLLAFPGTGPQIVCY